MNPLVWIVTHPKVFGIVAMVLDILMALGHWNNGNIRMSIYWFLATAMVYVLTF